jgi:hypothetical protein
MSGRDSTVTGVTKYLRGGVINGGGAAMNGRSHMETRTGLALTGLALLLPAMAAAEGSFNGTWKTRIDSYKMTGKPDVFDLSKGLYRCSSCVPEVKVKADGSDQAVSGHDYYDAVAVRVLSPTAFEVENKHAGKLISSIRYSVSDGGATLAAKFTDYTGSQPYSGSFTEKRVAGAPAGAHAASGSWQLDKVADVGDIGRTVSYTMSADGLKMSWNGMSYDAQFDGKDYPMIGDPGNTVVALKRVGTDTIEETDKRDGKVTDIVRSTVSSDGKTIQVVDTDPVHETRTSYLMDRQP